MADTDETEKKDNSGSEISGQYVTYRLQRTDKNSEKSIFKILELDTADSEEGK